MASRPPLGVSLADILGQPAPAAPKMSRGQIIAGIIGDALAGAAGRAPTFGPMVARQKEEQQQAAQQEAQWGRHLLTQRLIEQQIPIKPEGTSSQQDYEYAKKNGFTGSFTDFLQYTHPPSPVTLPAGATVDAPPQPNAQHPLRYNPQTGKWEPEGGAGGNVSGGFPTSYPDIGPYHRH